MKIPIFLSLALLASCKADSKTAGEEKNSESLPTQSPASSPTDSNNNKVKPSEPTQEKTEQTAALDEAKIKALVQRWLNAQNEGDFKNYSESYAERMTGIKRVGTVSKSYDRAHWLSDRERMFKKAMKVEANDLSIRQGGNSAIVNFTQSWSSGTFEDEGPKQLLIVREKGSLRIAREEMLASTVKRSKNGVNIALGLLLRPPDVTGFILKEAKHNWAKGPGTLKGGKGTPYIATRAAGDKLPAEYQLIGKKIIVYGKDGACIDTVKRLKIVVGLTPHFGYFQDENDRLVKKTKATIESDMFSFGTPYLMAELTGKCKGKIAEFSTTKRELVSFPPVKNDAVEAKVKATWNVLPGVTAFQADKDSYTEGDQTGVHHWAEDYQVKLFHDQAQDRYLAVVAGKGGRACGDFYGAMTAVFSIDAKNKVQLIATMDEFFVPSAALDFTKDGTIEFIGSARDTVQEATMLIQKTSKSYEVLHRFEWEFQDCSC